MHTAYLLAGSNIAPEENIPKALSLLDAYGVCTAQSATWKTPPIGTGGPYFHNLAIRFLTDKSADELKIALRDIERQLGRERTADKYAPRTMDLDIIIMDGQLIEPRLWSQPFAIIPLSELCPDYSPPDNIETLGKAAQRLLANGEYTQV